MEDDYPTFIYSYPFKGGQWSFEMKAKDAEEAEARLKALAWAKLDGELHVRIYIPDPRSPWRFLRRVMRTIRAMAGRPA